MNKEEIKKVLRPIFYPIFDYSLEISIKVSYKLYQKNGIIRILNQIWEIVLSLFGFRVYKVFSHADYCKLYGGSIQDLEINRVGKSIGLIYNVDQTPEMGDVELPDLFFSKYSNLIIHGDSDCILDELNRIVINDFASTMDTDRFSNPYGVIRIQKGHCAFIIKRKLSRTIDKGLSICTPGAGNLYHNVYDCMTKLHVINKYNILSDYPLIADEAIRKVPQLLELFNIMNRSGRDVIWIPERSIAKVHNLAVISSVNEMPVQLKSIENIRTQDFKYDISILKDFQSYLLQFKSGDVYPKRIFLSRKGFSRRSFNEEEIIHVAKKQNIDIVHPETLSFCQQLSLFNGAELIIGATGAAFTNILFCNYKTTAICMMGVDINLPIFTGGAYTSGCKLIYHIGHLTGKTLRYKIQSSFHIAPESFEDLLNDIEKHHHDITTKNN